MATLAAGPAQAQSFIAFLTTLKEPALAAGISAATFDAAINGLVPDPAVIALSRKQSEFTRPFWDYVNGAVSAPRLRAGGVAVQRAKRDLAAIGKQFGVSQQVLAGIWGMESNFGTSMGDKDILRSLASLAFARYRGTFYANEFIASLRILQEGHSDRAGFVGSWAGGMGQTQFIPSSFLKYAVDADGDGRKNIWSSTPDALASAANHLKLDGWIAGSPWGFEVLLPQNFNFDFADRRDRHSFAIWAQLGVQPASGAGLPKQGAAGLFMPVGLPGPSFLITDNFEVIRQYNTSDAYALGVGHLGDRLFGGAAIATPWPVNTRQLNTAELVQVQTRLKALGYPIDKIDGKLGQQTRQGVQGFQRQQGLVPDGHPSRDILVKLKA